MAKKLYIGNLAYNTSDQDLQSLFEQYGTVVSAQVIMDRETGRSKGFGFVEMSSADEAKKAVEALNETEQNGRNIKVSEAREREPRNNFRNR